MIFGIQAGTFTLLGTQIHSLSDVFLVLGSRMQTVSVQEVGCALATQNLTAAQYAQMTSALALEGETATLTAAKVQEAAATAGLSTSQASAIVTTLGLNTAQKGLAISSIAAKAGIIALNAALGFGIGIAILGISKALSFAAEKMDEAAHKSDKLKESIENLNMDTNGIENDLKELNDKLEETNERLTELHGIGQLNITDELETVELQKQNELLEAQIALKERELELKNEETNKTIEDWYEEAWQKDIYGSMYTSHEDPSLNGYRQKTEEQYFQEQLTRADELYNKQKRLDEQLASLDKSDIESMSAEQLKAFELTKEEKIELQEIQEYFTDIAGELNQQIVGYTAVTDEQRTILDNWHRIIIAASKYASYGLWQTKSSEGQNDDTVGEDVETLDKYLKKSMELVDEYQDRISSLQSIINSQNDISSSGLLDFMQQVSEWDIGFDWEKFGVTGERGVGNLTGALAELSNVLTEQINNKYPELSTQLSAILRDTTASATGFDTLSNALQTLSSHNSLLDSVAEAIKETGSISVETGNEIVAEYPQMQNALTDYLLGVKSAEDVYADLESLYDNDLDLYYQLILQKKEMDYSFYEQVYDNLPSWVQNYLDAYQRDFGNFKNLADAKIKLQKQFLNLEELSLLNSNDSTYLNYARQNINAQKSKLEDILGIIKETELDVSGIKEPVFNKDSEDRSEKDDSIQQIDWAAHSLDNISHHIDYLNKTLDNADGFKQRALYLTQLISSQNLYNEALEKQAKLYKQEYLDVVKSIPQYRKLIESGATFKVEEFVNQDELYETITNAQGLYTAWRDINTAQEDAESSLKDYKDKLNENTIEHLAAEIQLIQNEIDGIESTIDINTEFQVVGDERQIINSWKKEKYEELLALSTDMQKILQQKLLNYQSRLKDVKPETDTYYELQDNIAEVQQELNDCVKTQREYNSAILSLPLDQYQKQLDLIDKHIDILNKAKDKYSAYISAVTYSIDEEIDSITDRKESLSDYYDNLISPIQEQLNALQETNDERERALALQKAYYDLEKAKNNLSIKTYVDGQGFVYRPDENAVRDAQNALDSALYNKAIAELEKQITDYEKVRDALLKDYDDEINRLNDLKDVWSEVISKIESLAMINEFKLQFGDGTLTRIIDGQDTSTIHNITEWVSTIQGELDTLNIKKGNLEDVIATCELIVDSYEDGSINVDAAMNKMDSVVAEYTKSMTALNQGHVNSIIELSSEYKSALFDFSVSEENLTKDTESSSNKMKNVVSRACSHIKNAYSVLSTFVSSFRTDMIENLRSISAAASQMASDVANSAANANNAIGSINTNPPPPQDDNNTKTGLGIITGLGILIGLLFHDGMESGFVSKNKSEANRDSIFKRIALNDLKANEVPAVLQVGEAVLTKKQQANVVHNMVAGVDYGMRFAHGVNNTSNVNINIPEIHVHEVQNADVLAKEITKSFKTRMIQEVRK